MSARKTKKQEKTTLSPREQRIANAQKIKEADPVVKEEVVREDFRRYFIQLKRKKNLDPSLEDIMWLHFKAAGYADKSKFDDGVRHFGYDID